MELVLSKNEIDKICKNLGGKLTEVLKEESKTPIVVGVLKGALNFMMDLLKYIDADVFMDFIQVSSYNGTKSTGKVILKKDFEFDASDRTVVIVEDVIDTGISMSYLIDFIKKRHQPKKIIVVALFDKVCKRKMPVKVDYAGKVLNEDIFLYGYGLDFNEIGRNIPNVYHLNEKDVQELYNKTNKE